MNYYNLCFIIFILLLLAMILCIYNKYYTNIETLENNKSDESDETDETNEKLEKCDSLGIEINSNLNCPTSMSKINTAGNNLINFKQPPGLHAELNKLFIWRKLANCCIVDFTYHNNYIYAVGTNGKIYRVLKTGGDWLEYISSGSVTNIVISGNFIYGVNKNYNTYRHKIDGTGDWQEFGQKGWRTKQLFTDNTYLYGIGMDYKINYIPLTGGTWKNYSPGYIFYAMIFKNKIYGIGMNHSVYTYPLAPPPIQNNPVCKPHNNSVWSFCGDKPLKKWGIGKEGEQQSIRNCSYAASKDHFGKCPIVHTSKWEKLTGCCVTNIQGFGEHLYGRGTNGKIYKVSLESGGKWKSYITNRSVDNILIINNNLYGIGKDKALYIHPIKEDKVEEFTNYISPFNSIVPSLP